MRNGGLPSFIRRALGVQVPTSTRDLALQRRLGALDGGLAEPQLDARASVQLVDKVR
jgi:hypothetical protein